MSGFTSIDLSKLPAPEVIKTVEYEALLAEMKEEAIRMMPELEAFLALESEPATKILRICAYYRMLDRLEFNDGVRALMLAYSTGTNLDHLGAFYGVERPVIQEADTSVVPATPEIKQGDEEYRRLIQLSLEGHTTAGTRGSYIFWALKAAGAIKDVSAVAPKFAKQELDPSLAAQLPPDTLVLRIIDYAGLEDPMPGDVAVTILSREGDGMPSEVDLEAVNNGLNDEYIRPLTDRPRIKAPVIITYQVEATLILYEGPDASTVETAAEAALTSYIDTHHRLGHDITLSGIYAALHQSGVQNVRITKPVADIVVGRDEAAYCPPNARIITVGGRDV